MITIAPARATLSPSEVDEAISAINDAGWIRLQKVANQYSYGRIDPDDLLQEAFLVALNGSRKCPRHVDIVRFLAEAIRSIASSKHKSSKRKPELHAIFSTSEDNEIEVEFVSQKPNSEQEIISEQEAETIKREVLSLFKDDEIAQVILEGDMEEMEANDLYELTGLDKKQFASKRRLIRRRIERAYPKGWKQ